MRLIYRFFLILFALSVFLAGGLGGAAYWWMQEPLVLSQSPLDFRIVPGSSLRSALVQMEAAGLQVQPRLFQWLARWQGVETAIKAGSYEVKEGITPTGLLSKLTRGEVSQADISLIEGWNFRQWRSRLDQNAYLEHQLRGLTEAEIAKVLGIPAATPEGWLLPDTYLFDKQSSDIELLTRSYRAMQNRLAQAWETREDDLPYKTPYEALIMASIIEKETGKDSDRPMIAAVFVNRLRLGMRLQTDPTVIYGLGEAFDGNLRRVHLQTDHPHNTYTRSGLPPTPIAMPGLASLNAALHPAKSQAIYFVARGDGSSQFSKTLDEHNRAVNQYQRGRQ